MECRSYNFLGNALHVGKQSDRVRQSGKEEGGGVSLKGSPQHMKEVIYTQLRDHLKQLFKGSLKCLITDHHVMKLRGHMKQFRGNLKIQCDVILES